MAPGLVMGVDVGAARKGFDVVLLRGSDIEPPRRRQSLADVLELARREQPELVAIDSPRDWAPPHAKRRQGEVDLVGAKVCNIRWTPDEAAARAHQEQGGGYYDWIFAGLELYAGLDDLGVRAIECFPTASWSRWAGARDDRARSRWTEAALSTLGLTGVPARTTQDERDAIAAAVTARQHLEGETQRFGDIVVPRFHPLPRFRRVAILSRTGEPITSLVDWRRHAGPAGGDKGWKRGRSAQEAARAWLHGRAQQDVRELLETRTEFDGIVFESAIPEHQSSFDDIPGGQRNHDVLVVASVGGAKVVIGVEAKVDETFDRGLDSYIESARKASSGTRAPERLEQLWNAIFGEPLPAAPYPDVPYQLLPALAGTLAEARRRHAPAAVLLVHELVTPQAHPKKLKANAAALSDFLTRLGVHGRVSGHHWLVGPLHIPGNEHLPATLPFYVGKLRTQVR